MTYFNPTTIVIQLKINYIKKVACTYTKIMKKLKMSQNLTWLSKTILILDWAPNDPNSTPKPKTITFVLASVVCPYHVHEVKSKNTGSIIWWRLN